MTADVEPGVDVLSDVLRRVRLSASLFFFVQASSPWVAEAPAAALLAPIILPRAQHVVSYHVVLDGSCFCELEGEPALQLHAGDVLVIPHGDRYALSSHPGMLGSYPEHAVLDAYRHLTARSLPDPFNLSEGGGEPEQRRVLCGFLGCDALPFNPVLVHLPRRLVIRRSEGERDRLGHLIALAAAEARDREAGSECVLLRISELLFIEVVRRHLTTLRAGQKGWLAGLNDPTVGRALALLHERPRERWTVEELAKSAGVSRSLLAGSFTEVVGQPPMAYLARWRMQLAGTLLRESRAKVSAVALEVGYDSEAAFSRAFKSWVGVPPAVWRQQHASDFSDRQEGNDDVDP